MHQSKDDGAHILPRPAACARSRPALRRAGALGPICLGALVALDWFAVHTVPGRVLDGRSLRGALLTDSRATHAVERVLDVISVTSILVAVGVILGIALVRLRRRLGLAAIVLLLGANVTTQLLKQVVLTRPDLGLVEPAAATPNSLPSGHVTVAFSVATALVLVVPPALRAPVAVGGVAFTLATGIATMTAGWHRASDAIAACLVVGVWAAGVLAAVAAGGGVPVEPFPDRGTRRLGVTAAALLVAGALIAGGLLLTAPPGRDPAVLLWAYAAGGLLTGGAAAAVMAGVLLPATDP